jgi:hypothetical protein
MSQTESLDALIERRRQEERDRFGAKWRRESAHQWGFMAISLWIATLIAIVFVVALRDLTFALCASIFAGFLYLNGCVAWKERTKLLAAADALWPSIDSPLEGPDV